MTWMDESACRGIEGYTELPVKEQLIPCQSCPVIDQCRALGVEQAARSAALPRGAGVVYGGLLPREIAALARVRRQDHGSSDPS